MRVLNAIGNFGCEELDYSFFRISVELFIPLSYFASKDGLYL